MPTRTAMEPALQILVVSFGRLCRPIYKTPIDNVYYRHSVWARNLKYYHEGLSPFERRHRLALIGGGLRQWCQQENFAV